MDAAFLEGLRVSPSEHAAVMQRIEVAATQIATALVCSANPVDSNLHVRDWRLLRAYQVSLDIIHRAMSSPARRLTAVEELPPPLVLTLVQHPMLNHILIALDYTHLLLCERLKRSDWLQELHSDGATDQAIQAFAHEAVWSLLTSTMSAPDPRGTNGNNDTPQIEKETCGEAAEGSSYSFGTANKANSQSPETVGDGKERPLIQAPVTSCKPTPKLSSPLLCVPVWVRPSATENLGERQKKAHATPPRPHVSSTTLPVQLPLPAKAEAEWTLSEKTSHQATRLFRLHHAAECKDPKCSLPSCASMKHVLRCCVTPGGMACPLPFCFGAKCAILHLQSCKQVDKCTICRDYWERVACHQLATRLEQADKTNVALEVTPDGSELPTLKRRPTAVLEQPTARRSHFAKHDS
jgi:TAZ zinc finger